MLSTILDTVFNGILMGASGYAMFSLKPAEYPFAFAATAMGFCHGCTGICTMLFVRSDGSENAESKCLNCVKAFTASCMEIITVPLINMELYRNSQQISALALGHGLFIIPLAFDLTSRVFNNEEFDDTTAVLKDLTVLGNIVSLLFYGLNENNRTAGAMVLSAFIAYYGSIMMESALRGTGQNSSLAGYALFMGLIPQAIKAGGEGTYAL